MKRFVLFCFVLTLGAGLGIGGYYVALNWKRLNPFKNLEAIELAVADTTTQLRKSCSTEEPLKGAAVHSIRIDDGKLHIRGWVARKEQIALLETKLRSLMDASPELNKECDAGVSLDAVKVLPIADSLTKLQSDFDAGRGFEQDVEMRLLLRRTRIDAATFDEQANLKVSVVSIGANERPEALAPKIAHALRERLRTPELNAKELPEIAVTVIAPDHPIQPVMKALSRDEAMREARIVSAWYDGKGTLQIEGFIAKESQREKLSAAVAALAKDALTRDIVAKPGDKAAKPNVSVRLTLFDSVERTASLQKLLVQHAIKVNKPLLRRAVVYEVAPTPIARKDSGEAANAESASHIYRVGVRMFATPSERAEIEAELAVWLPSVLPTVADTNLIPIPTGLAVIAKEPPMSALQARIVERGLDGAVVTDVRHDEAGRLELLGRLHAPLPDAKAALDAVVKDVLAEVPSWTIDTLIPHEWKSAKMPAPTWNEVVAATQIKLAETKTEARRIRLDRLAYQYVKGKLVLHVDGAFLADGAKESAATALIAAIDDTIVSRDKISLDASGIKTFANPLIELQNRTAERGDLDGVLFTNIAYSATGELRFDGYLGDPNQKANLAKVIAERVDKMPGAVRVADNGKTKPGWSLDGFTPYPREKAVIPWPDFLRTLQTDFAEADDLSLRRTSVQRSYFRFEGEDVKRRLTLRWHGTYLAKRAQKVEPAVLSRTISDAAKRLLPESAIVPVEGEVAVIESPIYELQQIAVAQKYDGLLFLEASFDKAGKLVFDGTRGNDEQLRSIAAMIERVVTDKERKPIAHVGVAGFERMKPTPWLPLLTDVRANFASDKNALLRQTRIDRVFYTIDDVKLKPIIHVQGICIFTGKTLNDDEQSAVVTEMLKKRLQTHEIDGFEINIAGVDRKKNPASDMQKQANDTGIGGAVFTQIGFDAKGDCYVVVPFVPKGQDDAIRKVIETFTKSHVHLGPIRQVVSVPTAVEKK